MASVFGQLAEHQQPGDHRPDGEAVVERRDHAGRPDAIGHEDEEMAEDQEQARRRRAAADDALPGTTQSSRRRCATPAPTSTTSTAEMATIMPGTSAATRRPARSRAAAEHGVGERQQRVDRNPLHGRLRHHQRADEAKPDQRHAHAADPLAEQDRGADQHQQRRDLSERGGIGDLHVGERHDVGEDRRQFEQVPRQHAPLEHQRQLPAVAERQQQRDAPERRRRRRAATAPRRAAGPTVASFIIVSLTT